MWQIQNTPKNWKVILLAFLMFSIIWVLLAFGIHLASAEVTLGTDYYTFYTAARMYLFDGTNPYSDEVTQMAQLGIIGRPASPEEDQLAFAYPFFMLFLVIPFGWLDITYSQAFWMSLNVVFSVSVLISTLHNNKMLIVLALTSYPIVFGLFLGNFAYLLGFILLFVMDQIIFSKPPKSTQWLIGFLLAWTVGKPQLTSFILIFILMIGYKSKYFLILKSFALSTIILTSVSLLLIPEWPIVWLQQIQKYAQYNQSELAYIFSVLLQNTQFEGIVFPILIIATVVSMIIWHYLREKTTGKVLVFYDILFANFFLSLSLLLMPRTLSYDQILIFIGLVLGSKFLNNYKITIPLWLFYSSLSWITFASGDILGLSSTNVIFPLIASTTWPLLFWLINKKTLREFKYAHT